MSQSTHSGRAGKRRGALALGAALLLLLLSTSASVPEPASTPTSVLAVATPPPTTPTPAPTPAIQPHDFSQPAPLAEAVDNSYFSDAVFIGDSRTEGFYLYSGIKGSHFLYHQGLTIYDMGKKAVIRRGEEKITVLEALAQEQYAKVYVMLGVNELGYRDDEKFARTYSDFLQSVRQLQPEAMLYVQALVPRNTAVAQAHNQPSYVNNDRIATYNALIAQVAQQAGAVLVSVDQALVDPDTGEPPADYTADGVHFKRKGYQAWFDCLTTHTVDPEAYWAGQPEREESTL